MPTERAAALRLRVEAVLDTLRPGFAIDGGNVEVIEVTDDGTVRVELQGACVTCPARTATLRRFLEPSLRRAIPQLTAVVAVAGDPTPAAALAGRPRPS